MSNPAFVPNYNDNQGEYTQYHDVTLVSGDPNAMSFLNPMYAPGTAGFGLYSEQSGYSTLPHGASLQPQPGMGNGYLTIAGAGGESADFVPVPGAYRGYLAGQASSDDNQGYAEQSPAVVYGDEHGQIVYGGDQGQMVYGASLVNSATYGHDAGYDNSGEYYGGAGTL